MFLMSFVIPVIKMTHTLYIKFGKYREVASRKCFEITPNSFRQITSVTVVTAASVCVDIVVLGLGRAEFISFLSFYRMLSFLVSAKLLFGFYLNF